MKRGRRAHAHQSRRHTVNPSESNDLKTGLPRLVFDHLVVRYDGRPVLVDVSGVLGTEQVLTLVGPNGSGKTTLLRALTGAVEILGGEVHKPQGAIGYVPQNAGPGLSFPVTVEHVVMMGLYKEVGWGRFPRARHRARVEATLERVGLAELTRRRFGDLSGERRQRALLTCALVAEPALILLDGPFNGLDQPSRDALIDIIRDVKAKGAIIVASTHDLSLADSIRDQALLVAGRRIDFGAVDSVLSAHNLTLAYGGRADVMRSRLFVSPLPETIEAAG